MKRRIFLQASLATSQLALAISSGLLIPMRVLAAWPSVAFNATDLDQAIHALLGGAPVEPSDAIHIEAQNIAEDGRTVPVGVRSEIPDTVAISILSEKNPYPAVASFNLSPQVDPYISTRIKMGGSGHVVAVVSTKERHYYAKKRIQVTAGGCG
jgi:sulfur-oxidizing protein SoxY